MKTIHVKDQGPIKLAKEIGKSVDKRQSFQLVIVGEPAKKIAAQLGSGTHVGVAIETVVLVLGLAALATLAGLVVYAMSKGFEVQAEVEADVKNPKVKLIFKATVPKKPKK